MAAQYGVRYYGSEKMLVLVGKTLWKYRCQQGLKMAVLGVVFTAGIAVGMCL